ncbi:J domain-containing protein [Acidithiobacillus concretivorus]|uniref:J domain-containing protein n=1 Tax=Acidithiobacillus concretivorus TaxID=3063952 RepID=A0ABS5ZSQ1_9PROT|nr:J domain-containing protein [Acidithiobacillus concretivorus]MBU2739690.1 J domain-containing protein [Acidithiobacillus concretivorus]
MTDSQRSSAASLVITSAPSVPLSAAQKSFNRLSRQIARIQRDIQDWETTMAQIQRRALEELVPVQQQFQALRQDLLLQLDASSQTLRFGKVARATLSQSISELALGLLQEVPEGTASHGAIQEIYQRHTPEPESPLDDTALRGAVAEYFDLPPEAIAEESPESLVAFVEQMLRERSAAQLDAQLAAARQENAEGGDDPEALEPSREKGQTSAQSGRESQRAAQAEQIRQALQTIYRQLVRVIHPDREPDAERRLHKTVLMQRANQAYTEKDLLQLLALQQELGQIDEQMLGTWGEETLKTYNRVLKAHVEGLQHQVEEIQARASACVGVPTFFTLTRRDLMRDFEETLREMRAAVVGMQVDLQKLQSEEPLKAWLQQQRRAIRRQAQRDWDTEMYWVQNEA